MKDSIEKLWKVKQPDADWKHCWTVGTVGGTPLLSFDSHYLPPPQQWQTYLTLCWGPNFSALGRLLPGERWTNFQNMGKVHSGKDNKPKKGPIQGAHYQISVLTWLCIRREAWLAVSAIDTTQWLTLWSKHFQFLLGPANCHLTEHSCRVDWPATAVALVVASKLEDTAFRILVFYSQSLNCACIIYPSSQTQTPDLHKSISHLQKLVRSEGINK